MSQLPQPTPINRGRRSIGFDFGQAQPTRLDVVPFASSGPDYSAARQTAAFGDALTGAVGTVGQFAAGINQDRDREAALTAQDGRIAAEAADQMVADQQRAFKNAAALRSNELDPQIGAAIEDGTLAPLPDESLEQFKNKIIDAYAGNESPEYRAEMDKLLGPRIIGRAVNLAQKGRALAEQASDDGTVARALFAQSPAEAQAIIDDAAFAVGNTPERVQSMKVRTMLGAAESGNKPLVDAMKARLGDSAPEQIIKANNALAQYDARAKTQQREDFYNFVDDLILRNAPLSIIGQFIDESGMEAGDKMRAIRTARGEYADQIKQAEIKTENAILQADIDKNATAVLGGGSAFRPLLAPLTLPSGRTISTSDQNAAYAQSFQRQTGFTYADLFSEDAASTSRSRAYMVALTDSGTTDPAFASLGKRVSLSADDAKVATDGDVQAVSAFRKARAFGLAPMVFDTNDPTYAILDNAARMIDKGGQPNGLSLSPKEAIIAAKAQYHDGLTNRGVTAEDVARAFKADPSMTPQQAQRVARTAKNYALNSPPDVALDDAAKAELVDTATILIPSGPQKFWDTVNPLNLNPFDIGGQYNAQDFGTRQGKRFDLGVLATADETTKTALGMAAGTILSQRVDAAAKANPAAGITADSFYLRSTGPGLWEIREVGNGLALPNGELNRTVTKTELATLAQAYTRATDESLPSTAALEAVIAKYEPLEKAILSRGNVPGYEIYSNLRDARRDLKIRQAMDTLRERSKNK